MTRQVRYREILYSLRTHVIELDSALRVTFENRRVPRFTLGGPLLVQLPECSARRIEEAIAAASQNGVVSPFSMTHEGVTSVAHVTALSEEEGGGFCLTLEEAPDTLERREERRRLEVALQASGVGLWSFNLANNVVHWDDRMREISGEETPINFPEWIEKMVHPDDRHRLQDEMIDLAHPGEFRSAPVRIVRRDGEMRWVIAAGTVTSDEAGRPNWVVGGLMDVTDQQKMADKLQEAHRMETLGHLTGGVAHNFNNMLMIIEPCLEAIRETVRGSMQGDVDDALEATRRASEIVAQLMTFAGHKNQGERTARNVRQICEETARLCRRSFPTTVSLEVSIETDAEIECSPGALEQVIGNLLFNARDAVFEHRGKGRVSLRAEEHAEFDEGWLMVTVSDDGPGVPAELRAKMFEPFVTTKTGKGTGLGLASSLAIVQQHGGQLAYRPSALGGADFLVVLPRRSASAQASKSAPRHIPVAPVRRTCVLLVDDEPAIRRLLKSGLERHGYDVDVADGSTEVERLLQYKSDFAVVLLDRSLGQEDGAALVPVVRARCPEARVYFFTGEFITEEQAAKVDGVIQKPVNIRRLADVLAEGKSP